MYATDLLLCFKMASLTTSYFAVNKHLKGTKISIARFNFRKLTGKIEETQNSFAPSTTLLKAYKNGDIGWERYKKSIYKNK